MRRQYTCTFKLKGWAEVTSEHVDPVEAKADAKARLEAALLTANMRRDGDVDDWSLSCPNRGNIEITRSEAGHVVRFPLKGAIEHTREARGSTEAVREAKPVVDDAIASIDMDDANLDDWSIRRKRERSIMLDIRKRGRR